MIDGLSPSGSALAQTPAAPARMHFRMVRPAGDDDRMAGSMPVWSDAPDEPAESPDSVAARLDNAAQNPAGDNPSAFKDALAYAAGADKNPAPADDSTGFGISDIIGALNPLQHIPVVSYIYREVTGDTLSPVAEIAGDTLYGGAIGGISAVADVLVQQGTGKDIAQNLVAFVSGGTDGAATDPNAPP